MVFTVIFHINPPGDFGLPEKNSVVIPGNLGSFYGPTVNSDTGVIAEYGTLPVFRKQEERIDVTLSLPSCNLRILDNIVFCKTEAADSLSAMRISMNDLGRFLRLLSAHRNIHYSAYPISITDTENRSYRVPDPIRLASFRVYYLPNLLKDLIEMSTMHILADEKLNRATAYMQNALLLMDEFYGTPNRVSTVDFNVVPLIVLELWKCCSAIMGDPAVRKDRYQKLYKEIGISEEIKVKVDTLYKLRNDYDVAHYSLITEKRQLLEKELSSALITAKQVVDSYMAHLRIQKTNSDN